MVFQVVALYPFQAIESGDISLEKVFCILVFALSILFGFLLASAFLPLLLPLLPQSQESLKMLRESCNHQQRISKGSLRILVEGFLNNLNVAKNRKESSKDRVWPILTAALSHRGKNMKSSTIRKSTGGKCATNSGN